MIGRQVAEPPARHANRMDQTWVRSMACWLDCPVEETDQRGWKVQVIA